MVKTLQVTEYRDVPTEDDVESSSADEDKRLRRRDFVDGGQGSTTTARAEAHTPVVDDDGRPVTPRRRQAIPARQRQQEAVSPARVASPRPAPRRPDPQIDEVLDFQPRGYIAEILHSAAIWLKQPISVAIVLLVIGGMLFVLLNLASAILSPVCNLPGMTFFVPACSEIRSHRKLPPRRRPG